MSDRILGAELTGITNGGISTKSYTYDAAGRNTHLVQQKGANGFRQDVATFYSSHGIEDAFISLPAK